MYDSIECRITNILSQCIDFGSVGQILSLDWSIELPSILKQKLENPIRFFDKTRFFFVQSLKRTKRQEQSTKKVVFSQGKNRNL
jgi:hypothetical protein